MSQEFQNYQAQFMNEIRNNTGFTICAGVILLLMGLLAMGSPLVAGLSVAMMVGIMLIIGGICQLVFAVKTGKGLFTIILSVLTIVVGGYMLKNLGVALASLTIFLASYFIVSGIFETMMAFQIKPIKGWGWTLFSGIISILLGVMIWKQFPLSGTWAIGILFGVRLFFSGWTLIMLGVAARGMAEEITGQ